MGSSHLDLDVRFAAAQELDDQPNARSQEGQQTHEILGGWRRAPGPYHAGDQGGNAPIWPRSATITIYYLSIISSFEDEDDLLPSRSSRERSQTSRRDYWYPG